MTRRRLARVGIALAASVLAAWASLFLGTRWVLASSRLLGWIDGDPDSLFVAYTGPSASLLPGRVFFESLTLRVRDPNVEFEARLENVELRVSLAGLLGRRFHARSVDAARLVFRLRERLTRAEATGARLARYPPVTGFPDPPMRDDVRPPAPQDPWRVQVDALRVARVGEIWIGSWRFEGDASVTGAFRLRPGIRAEVLESVLRVVGGSLTWGKETVSHGLTGEVRASLPDFDIPTYHGNEVWKIMSGSLRLDGSLQTLAYLAPDATPPVSGGAGRVAARLSLAAGAGKADVDATLGRFRASIGERVFGGAARLHLRAPRIDFPGEAVALDGTRLELEGVTGDGSGATWSGAVAAARARLSLAPVSLAARVETRLGDGRPLLALVPPGPPRWIAGLVDLRDFDAHGNVAASGATLALTDAHAEAGSFRVDADWRRAGARTWGALLARKGVLALGVALGSSGSSLHPTGASSWFEDEGRPGGLRTAQPRAAIAPRRAK